MPTAADLRNGLAGLVRLAHRDLAGVWAGLQLPDSSRGFMAAFDTLNDVLPRLIDTYGIAAAALAADWYDNLREQQQVRRRYTAEPATIADSGVGPLIGWALNTAVDDQTLRQLVEGGTQRRIADYSRQTITDSSVKDPAAAGWQRVGGGQDCDWCQMLIDRGAVYSETGADFPSHDHCECGAEPVYT